MSTSVTIDRALLPKGVEIADRDLEGLPQPVVALILLLLKTIEELSARLKRDSSNSSRPPSSDSPYDRPKRAVKTEPGKIGKPGAKPGHSGHRQPLITPIETIPVMPEPCPCGGSFPNTEPYYTHQYIELPEIKLLVKHFVLHKGHCNLCGKTGKGHIPHEFRYGFGPRFTAFVAEIVGVAGNSRDTVRSLCSSVLGLSISLGTIQKLIDRASAAIVQHYAAIADKARSARLNHLDETSWRNGGKLHWLWVMVNHATAFFMIHANRSQKAFEQLIGCWDGILVSDNYAVYRNWTNLRQTCLAHLIREAKALAQREDKQLAACGRWTKKELKLLCKMAHEPPTLAQWRAFFARLCRLIDLYRDCDNEAGRLVRLLDEEMECLFVFLYEHGVHPTNNLAERSVRYAVLWRKRSFGCYSDKGCRWVERILTLRHTCRLNKRPSFPVLADALTAHSRSEPPDISWINAL